MPLSAAATEIGARHYQAMASLSPEQKAAFAREIEARCIVSARSLSDRLTLVFEAEAKRGAHA